MRKAWLAGAILLAAAMATQYSARTLVLGVAEGGYARDLPSWAGLTPAYALLGVLLVTLPFAARGRPRREWLVPPAAPAAFGLWAVLCLFAAPWFFPEGFLAGRPGELKEALQRLAVFLGGGLVFAEALRGAGRRALLGVFLAAAAVNIAAAWGQYLQPGRYAAHEVMGCYANRHTFGLLLCLALPLAAGVALAPGAPRALRLAVWILVPAGLGVLLSGGAWLAAGLGVLAAGALAGRGRLAAAAGLVASGALLAAFLPCFDNPGWLGESLASLAPDGRGGWQPARQRVRAQAAGYVVRQLPLCGAGPGSFRQAVKQGYAGPRRGPELPNPSLSDNPHYHDTDGAFTVAAVETGLVGALFLAGLLVSLAAGGARQALAGVPGQAGWGAGLAGAGLALLAASPWSNFLVRGLDLPFLLFWLAANQAARPAPAAAPAAESPAAEPEGQD